MSTSDIKRIGVIGFGAMGKYVVHSLQTHNAHLDLCILSHTKPEDELSKTTQPLQYAENLQEFIEWQPDLVVECAGHSAVVEHVPLLLQAGIDVVIASIGVLADDAVKQKLQDAADTDDGRLILVSGAVGGLDALRSAKAAGLTSVCYTGRKPPHAWTSTPAEKNFNLEDIDTPTSIFKGTASEAAMTFPKNANVAAAVALSGIGFDDTMVELIADPAITKNTHEITAVGGFGELNMRLSNNPLPDNPKTSWLAALSIEEAVIKQLHNLTF